VDSGYLFHFFNHSREISGNPKPHALRNKIERVRDRDQLFEIILDGKFTDKCFFASEKATSCFMTSLWPGRTILI